MTWDGTNLLGNKLKFTDLDVTNGSIDNLNISSLIITHLSTSSISTNNISCDLITSGIAGISNIGTIPSYACFGHNDSVNTSMTPAISQSNKGRTTLNSYNGDLVLQITKETGNVNSLVFNGNDIFLVMLKSVFLIN